MAVTSVWSDTIPVVRHTDKTIPPKAVTMGTITTSQIRPDKTRVRPHPLLDEIHDEGFDLKATRTDENHDPNDRDCGLQFLKTERRSTTQGRLPTPVRRPRKPGDDDEDHDGDHIAQDGRRTTAMPTVPPRPAQKHHAAPCRDMATRQWRLPRPNVLHKTT